MVTLPLVDPLQWNVPIVDVQGQPSPELQRKWGQQAAVNKALLAAIIAASSPTAGHGRMTFSAPGLFSSQQLFPLPPAPQAMKFPSATASTFLAGFPPNGNPVFYLVQNLPLFLANSYLLERGAIARLTCAAGSGVGTVTWLGHFTVPFGQILTLVMPMCADLVLGNIVAQFVGDPL